VVVGDVFFIVISPLYSIEQDLNNHFGVFVIKEEISYLNIMKKLLVLFTSLCFLSVYDVNAQVKIGADSNPCQGAILDLNATPKGGLLLPRVEFKSLAEIPQNFVGISGAATAEQKLALRGSLVWNSAENSAIGIVKGVYFWNGSQWIRLICQKS
jgi:hypothetical protein